MTAQTAWRPVSSQLARVRRLTACLDVGVLALAASVTLLVLRQAAAALAVLLATAILLTWIWRAIGRNVAAWGYAERESDLLIRSGVLVKRLVVAPYGRMQFLDVTSGPIERAFGLATLRLHTAAATTDAHLPGLDAEEAARLRDRLTERGQAQAAGL